MEQINKFNQPPLKTDQRKQQGLATRAVRSGLARSQFNETSEALYLSSGFVYGSAAEAEATFAEQIERFRYGRIGSPTVEMFQNRLASIEEAGYCYAVASGMSATFVALTALLRQGDRVVAGRSLFSSSQVILQDFLPRWGISCEQVDATDLQAWRKALQQPTKAVLIETPSNPLLEITDIAAVAEYAHAVGAKVIVDNVFATPILQKPLQLGADLVYYSATKHIDGQGRVLGGAILGNDADWARESLFPYLYHTGAILSPFNSWVLLKGLETLPIRTAAQSQSATRIAEFLEQHTRITRVFYPGLPSHPQYRLAQQQMPGGSTLLAFRVKGNKQAAFALLDNLQIIDISNNLGDSKSLATHPATTTHHSLSAEQRQQQGITDSTIRLSVGLEDCNDLISDLDQALQAISA